MLVILISDNQPWLKLVANCQVEESIMTTGIWDQGHTYSIVPAGHIDSQGTRRAILAWLWNYFGYAAGSTVVL